jgi:hypothetical protein
MILAGTNISMTRGDTETLTVRCSEIFEPGDTVYMTVRSDAESPVEFQKEITEFGPQGEAVIVIEHDDTEGMDFGTYRYDIQVSRGDGRVTTLVKPSALKLTEEITHE